MDGLRIFPRHPHPSPLPPEAGEGAAYCRRRCRCGSLSPERGEGWGEGSASVANSRGCRATANLRGYPRPDGRKGIRNVLVVAYLVECAHHVAREIAAPFRDGDVHLIGFPGCYPNAYALGMMEKLCTHPNVGGALLVSLGCEGFDKRALAKVVAASGRPVHTLGIQDAGGTRATIAAGRAWVDRYARHAAQRSAACRCASTNSSSARSAAAPTRRPGSPPIRRWASHSTCSSPTARRRSSRRPANSSAWST